jgi:hypothetical protein
MKDFLLLLAVLLLCSAGCQYHEPLSEIQNIPIDQAWLGHWDLVDEKDESQLSAGEWILVLKYSDTEYLIHYHDKSCDEYFRAYPLKVVDINCLQLQLIGDGDGFQKKGEPTYVVASVTLTGNEATVRMLNSSLVGAKLRGPALRAAFLKNAKAPDLFEKPGKLRRAKKG